MLKKLFRNAQSAVERRELLKKEGKIQLPLNVDTRKYMFSFVRYKDFLIALPLFIIAAIAIYIMKNSGGLTAPKALIAIAPWASFLTILSIQHPERKNISFFEYRFIWKLKFNKRQKLFIYKKGGEMKKKGQENEKNIKDILGIKNIHSDCYETNDKRLIKVIKVSSVNISLLNTKDKALLYTSYESFLNDLPRSISPQINQIAQPVNLKQYAHFIKEVTSNETNSIKRLLVKGYLNFVEDIQQSRNMVSKNRYIIISKSFTQNRDKALEQLENDTKLVKTTIENMFNGQFQLDAKILNNEELFNLYYTCIDYENAQVNSNFNGIASPVTLGQQTYNEISRQWAEKKSEHIL